MIFTVAPGTRVSRRAAFTIAIQARERPAGIRRQANGARFEGCAPTRVCPGFTGTDARGCAIGNLLVKEGRITAAGSRFRDALNPPHDQPLVTSEHIVPFLVLPDSDPATWKDHTRFCPIHGRTTPVTLTESSPDYTWSDLCGRRFTVLACPRCLYCFHSVLSAMS